jgi:cation transporter-like permease
MINRRHKFSEPPESSVLSSTDLANSSQQSSSHQECVVVNVATGSNNDPLSGKTFVYGNSIDQTQTPSNLIGATDYSSSSSSSMKKSKPNNSGFLANIFNSMFSPDEPISKSFSTSSSSSSLQSKKSVVDEQQQQQQSNFILPTVVRRLSVLVSLLLLQSMSQFVLEAFEDVVQANIVIPLFLTMLVGAGGNAGNQSAVRAIAMLAKGELSAVSKLKHILPFVKRECVIGFICALVLSFIGALRVFAHQMMRRNHNNHNSNDNNNNDYDRSSGKSTSSSASDVEMVSIGATVLAISLSLFLIVALSCVIGVVLPFVFLRLGMSPEHAAPAIQVIMDVLGVFLTCVVCSMLLPSSKTVDPNVNGIGVDSGGGGGGGRK